MSIKVTSSPPHPELPAEIWLMVFRFATFIPLETDVSVTTIEMGLFCSFDEIQPRLFEAVLPLRRTIVQVSRRFYRMGAEVLYTTFHAKAGRIKNSDRRLLLFSELLVSRPELGRFVKQLSLQWSVQDEERNYQIISRCPNVMVFSSFLHSGDIGHVRWWGGGLPKNIRSLDATVTGVRTENILAILAILPHLEILHLFGLQGDSIPHAPASLPALRILSMYVNGTESCLRVLSTMQLPRLTALSTNVGNVDACRSFPLDVWRQLEYFKPHHLCYSGLRADHFHNLRHLHLFVGPDGIQACTGHFPFHRLECLTLRTISVSLRETHKWQKAVGLLVVLPLDAKAMPKLKLFQLELASGVGIGYSGMHERFLDDLGTSKGRRPFIRYFTTLVTKFERRGVLFAETRTYNNQGNCPAFQPIRDVLAACKRP
jgi:hypothetical protein